MNDLFKQISELDQKKILKMLEANCMKFPKNSKISSFLKEDNMIGYIIQGYIQITKIDYNGNRIIIDEIAEKEIFGSILSLLEDGDYEIVAKEDTEIIIIDYDTVLEYQINCDFYQKFLQNLLQIIMEKTKEKNERIAILAKRSIRNKILEYFRIFSKKQGSKYVYLPFTFTDLADYLAVDRSAMSRELKYLKEEHFIEIKGRKITLLYDRDSSLYS